MDNKMRYGRRRLSKYLFLTYNIKVNPRTLGNYMKRLNLFTFVRRKRDKKNTKMLMLGLRIWFNEIIIQRIIQFT
ncbi:transposase [Mycoplasmopsis cynos]|uniref:hypothetical protein n=1 Tax=Mycoplasmopsis cynos TaxID=171284 RepID=UPI0021FC9FA3|nr:hypothetical protein [Mycoplasmopsis cynos]UWV94035.1 transposase [Mycoplasmopsis cynos]WAM06516.1 transposase [Mycoplasmopsis cynos]WAM09945.1 transposase [Mycoplasmopsis cynos]